MVGLKQLMLIIKKGFKFLNALSLGLKNMKVLFTRQRNQVVGAVIIPNTIKVMNNPTRRYLLLVRCFPYQDVLPSIWMVLSSLARVIYHHITQGIPISSTLPVCAIFAKARTHLPRFPQVLPRTATASVRILGSRSATINAGMLMGFTPHSHNFSIVFPKSFFVFLIIFFSRHTNIIPHYNPSYQTIK